MRVYRDGSDWIEEAILTAPDETEGTHCGNAVAVGTADSGGGDVVLVGALNDDHAGAPSMDGLGEWGNREVRSALGWRGGMFR